jgi:membrane protein DedA with SNARE-associated domain
MPIALVFFVHYAYLIVFLWVLVEQVGIPIPSIPVLLTAGTLSATHTVNPFYIAIAVLSACLIADTIWFALGRRFGNNVLKLLCRLSFEASTCVSKTEGYCTRRGPVTLLFAKFGPGLSTVAAPIAGQTGMPYPKFLMWDLAGSLIWGETFILAGRFFGDLAKKSGPLLHWLGRFAFLIFILMVLGFLAHRIWKQRKFLQQVRELRLEPTELKEMHETTFYRRSPSSSRLSSRSSRAPRSAPHRAQRTQGSQRDHPSRSRRHPLLHLPQRGDQRQACPAVAQDGCLPRPASSRRLRRLEGSRVPPG